MVAADLEQVLANMGMRLGRSTNREVWALCPGHDDTHPTSFSVNRDTGASFCFACGYRRGDLVALTVDVMELDAWSAARWLRENGASLSARIERVRDRAPRKGSARGAVTSSGYSIEGEFAIFGDVPKSELKKRRLTREAVDHYEIRWDEEAGEYIVPIKDLQGKLQGWQRRRKPRPKNYPKEMSKSLYLFGAYEFEGDRAILVESPLDAVRLWGEGYVGVVSSFGSWVSYAQIKTIQRLANRVLIAMDDDEAGLKSTEELVKFFAPKVPTHVFSYDHVGEDVKDPGDMESAEIDRGISGATFVTRVPGRRRVVRR